MMSEIDLNDPAVATTATGVGTVPTGTPQKSSYAEDIDQSETFNDEEEEDSMYGDEEKGDGIFKVTKRRLSGGSSGDENTDYSVRRRAILWTGGVMGISLVIISVIVLVSTYMIPSSSSAEVSSSKNTHSNRVGNDEEAERESELPPWYGNATTSFSSNATSTTSNTAANIVMIPSDDNETEPLPIALGCLTDHFDNEHNPGNNRLYPGQFICSRNDDRPYRFGLTLFADIVMEDTETNSLTVIYENAHHPGKKHQINKDIKATLTMTPDEMAAAYHPHNFHFYLTLQTDGSLVMNQVHYVTTDDGNSKKNVKALWTAAPKQGAGEYLDGATIELLEQCLPEHDCPYLHLNQGGVMVLNWVDDSRTDSWQAKNFMHVYGF